MMEGEDGESESEGSFNSKSVWARIAVVAAGPVFNFILAFLLALIVIGTAGFDRPEVKGVMEGYPAEEAGLQAGDIIKEINGKNIHIYREVSVYTLFHSNENLEVTYERDGEEYTCTIAMPAERMRGSRPCENPSTEAISSPNVSAFITASRQSKRWV